MIAGMLVHKFTGPKCSMGHHSLSISCSISRNCTAKQSIRDSNALYVAAQDRTHPFEPCGLFTLVCYLLHCRYMQRNTLVGVLAFSLLFAGVVFYTLAKPHAAKAPGTPEAASSGITLPLNGYTERTPYYDIAANYPTTTPLSDQANSTALGLMKDFVGSTITEFKTSNTLGSITPETAKSLGIDQGRKESLQITYLIASSPRTVSYIFTTYTDTLGAHGNIFFHTFTFDTKTGAALSLADLFTPNAPYLTTLSSLSRAQLPSIIGTGADTQTIANGTTPVNANFENFFLDNTYLVILFAPYQVASYAAGPQTLRISISTLANILKPEYSQP